MECNIEFTQHEEPYEPALSSESETEANEEDNDNSQDIAVWHHQNLLLSFIGLHC